MIVMAPPMRRLFQTINIVIFFMFALMEKGETLDAPKPQIGHMICGGIT